MDTLLAMLAGAPADIPDPAPIAPPGVSQALAVVFGYGKWIAYAVCGLAAIAAGARFAFEVRQHGGSSEAARQLLFALVGAGVVSGGVALVSSVVVK